MQAGWGSAIFQGYHTPLDLLSQEDSLRIAEHSAPLDSSKSK